MTAATRPGGTDFAAYVRWAHRMADTVVSEYERRSYRPKQVPRSADDLHEIIKSHFYLRYGQPLEVVILPKESAFKEDVFLGLTLRHKDGRATITLNPYQERKGKRFGLVKEGFHALLDDSRLYSTAVRSSVEDYQKFVAKRDFSQATSASWGEVIAEIAAMEALFPYSERKAIVEAAGGRPSGRACKAASTRFGVPERWVRFYLRRDIMDQLQKFRKRPTTNKKKEMRTKTGESRPKQNSRKTNEK